MSRSMSWLIVAKMPLLISSRMMSATLTVRSSASSLTVMVAGQLDRATLARVDRLHLRLEAPSRRGGLRGPRRPRVPLLLLATGSSFDGVVVRVVPEVDARKERRGDRGLERPTEGALGVGDGQTRCRPADVRAATGQPAGLVSDDHTVRRADDADELALGPTRPARDARPRRRRPGRRAGAADAAATTPPPRRQARWTPLRRRPSWWFASA